MNGNRMYGQHLADAAAARVHAYPCAIARGSWLSIVTHTMFSGLKPQPRRFLRIS